MALLKRKRSGLHDPMTVVTNFVNACNRHDSEGVSACLHSDFDSIQPMYPSRNFRGAEQVRKNWQAIFDAEPGFRLTVLRSAAAGDTVWLEMHGAGRDAEVAGVFVMGVQNERIRWARIYSALVEDAPAATSEDASASPAPLRQVPPLLDEDDWSQGATISPAPPVQEDLIAPVVEIDGKNRARRGRGRATDDDGSEASDALGVALDDPKSTAGIKEPSEEPTLEEPTTATEAVAATGTRTPLHAQADSIDPAGLIDPEDLTSPDPTGEPDVVVDPGRPTHDGPSHDGPAHDGPDYDFKVARTVTPSPDEKTGDGARSQPGDAKATGAMPASASSEAVSDADATMAVDAVEVGPETPGDADVLVETMVEVRPGIAVAAQTAVEPEAEAPFFVEPVLVEPVPAAPAAGEPVAAGGAEGGAEANSDARPGLIVTTPPPPTPAEAPGPPKEKKRKPLWRS